MEHWDYRSKMCVLAESIITHIRTYFFAWFNKLFFIIYGMSLIPTRGIFYAFIQIQFSDYRCFLFWVGRLFYGIYLSQNEYACICFVVCGISCDKSLFYCYYYKDFPYSMSKIQLYSAWTGSKQATIVLFV